MLITLFEESNLNDIRNDIIENLLRYFERAKEYLDGVLNK